jgi:hypothetical protein
MTSEAIAKFLDSEKVSENKQMRIDLKKRNSISGLVVKGKDYDDLRSKNFWRIVTAANLAAWKRTGNVEFAKIYSGAEFNKITLIDAEAVA